MFIESSLSNEIFKNANIFIQFIYVAIELKTINQDFKSFHVDRVCKEETDWQRRLTIQNYTNLKYIVKPSQKEELHLIQKFFLSASTMLKICY